MPRLVNFGFEKLQNIANKLKQLKTEISVHAPGNLIIYLMTITQWPASIVADVFCSLFESFPGHLHNEGSNLVGGVSK